MAGAGALVLLLAGSVSDTEEGQPADWVGWSTLAIGVTLLVLAANQWHGRPRAGAEPVTPKWMEAIDSFAPPKAFGTGIALTALNPKNLILTIAGMAAIVRAGIPGGEEAAALAVFTVIASLGVAIPVAMFFVLGDRSGPLLARVKDWMAQNNAIIMAVILLLIGVKLIGDAISALT